MKYLRKILCLLLCAVFMFAFAGCDLLSGTGSGGNGNDNGNGGDNTGDNGNEPGGNEDPILEDNSGKEDGRYNLETYVYPLWEGNTVYNETLWFAVENYAPLLYEPERVISVRSYDLKTTYTEGTDYVVDGNSIVLLPNGRIPYMTESEYFPATPPNPGIVVPHEGGGYWYMNEGQDISMRQVVVTYEHKGTRNWTLPQEESAKFSKTLAKLENGERVKVVFYGDSITVGANASGFLNCAPYAESYADMVKSYMEARYPAAQIDFANTAVGGTDSNWGNSKKTGIAAIDNISVPEGVDGDHFKVRVLDEAPDLLFIAYGMNDQDYTPYVRYQNNIADMIEKVRAQNPNVEIMLISGMIANPETPFYNKDYAAYEESLRELTERYENVGLARTLSTVLSVYAQDEEGGNGKRFQDCTANNANHPNDFMMRIYAQTVLYSLFDKDYIDHI